MKLAALVCVLLGAMIGVVPGIVEFRKKRRRDAAKRDAAARGGKVAEALAGAYDEVANQASLGNLVLMLLGAVLVIAGAVVQFVQD
ncbi:MAG: hypothetical protein D6782_11895 [Alphaproteobacteria bacterium]|nr:MAG: hypothetical protein D6782_11895 [Alphaproteobacteria bacterium]